jgi:hypothetical protein
MKITLETSVELIFQPILKGRDVIVQSQSGTGKTCVFCLGALQAISTNERDPQVTYSRIGLMEPYETYSRIGPLERYENYSRIGLLGHHVVPN